MYSILFQFNFIHLRWKTFHLESETSEQSGLVPGVPAHGSGWIIWPLKVPDLEQLDNSAYFVTIIPVVVRILFRWVLVFFQALDFA